MSRWGKVLFFAAWLAIAILFAVRYILGGWMNFLYVPMIISIVCFIAAIFIDVRFYLDFFTMRTTKHGLNMGTMIVLVLVGLVTVNVLAVRKNKVWDVTEDKLFSLSQQSVDVLNGLKSPLRIVILFNGEKARDALNAMRENLRPFEDASAQVQLDFFDAYLEPGRAQTYLNTLPDKSSPENKVFLFVEHEDKRERITAPFGESEITAAIVKATRKANHKIYFLTGHGERDLESSGDDGLSGWVEQLSQSAARSEKLNLLETQKVPDDAAAIVIVGPRSPMLDNEISLIHNYLSSGGRLLVMADPGEKHDIQKLLKPLGIEFANTYVISVGVQVQGLGPEVVVATDFDQNSAITKPFVNGNTYALMYLATEVKKSPDANDIQVTEIIRSPPRSLALTELSSQAKKSMPKAFALAASAKGQMKKADGTASEKSFEVVVFGDSDFATNKLIGHPTNLNLASNAVASLTGETDLISIRPKQPNATKLVLSNATWLALVLVCVAFPLALIVAGSATWFRRRSA